MYSLDDTITAISSAIGEGGIGIVKLNGAAPYLEDMFGLSAEDANEMHGYWMKDFSEEQKRMARASRSRGVRPAVIERGCEVGY